MGFRVVVVHGGSEFVSLVMAGQFGFRWMTTPQGCVGGRLSSSKKKTRQRRREGLRRRVTSRLCKESLEKIDVAGLPDCSFANPTFQG